MTAVILGLGSVGGHAQSQIYYYSGPVSGYTGVDLSPDGFGRGGFVANFGTITENLYYDPATQNLEQVGSVTVNPSSGSFNIYGSLADDPNGSGSATLTVGNNGSFSFDFYAGNSLFIPVSGSGIYDGQAFSGSWNIQIPMITDIIAVSPTSLTFSDTPLSGAPQANAGIWVGGIFLADGVSDGTFYTSWGLDGVAAAVPEPNSLALLSLGLSALALLRRR